MLRLLIFILATYGFTMILVDGKIFRPVRRLLGSWHQILDEFVHCYMCVGLWVALGLCGLSRVASCLPSTETPADFAVYSVLGAGTTWLLHGLDLYLNPFGENDG